MDLAVLSGMHEYVHVGQGRQDSCGDRKWLAHVLCLAVKLQGIARIAARGACIAVSNRATHAAVTVHRGLSAAHNLMQMLCRLSVC